MQGNPLEEFFLRPIIRLHLLGFDISVTQAVVSLWLIVGLTALASLYFVRVATLVPGRFQTTVEMIFDTLIQVVDDNVGQENRKKFLLPIFTLFLFVFLSNFLGLIPGIYTVTSQIVVTGVLAVTVYLVSLMIGFVKHGFRFLSILVPEGVPGWMLPLVIPIEIISQLARPLSLAVRLFANMTAGHTILFVLFTLTTSLVIYLKWLPFSISVVLYLLEVLVAFIQAYIFAVLSAVYLGQAMKLNH